MIFGYVVGSQLIHICGDRSPNDSILCSAPISETQAQERFDAIDPDLFEQPDKSHGWSNRFSRDRS